MTLTLTRFTLSVTALCAVLVGGVLLLGVTLPIAAHASLFTSNPCALPCVFGVTPGVTLPNDAMMALEQQDMSYSFLSQNQSASFTVRENRSARSTLTLLNFGSAGDMSVSATFLYQMASGSDLGILSDFLLAGYQPMRVFSNCQSAERLYIVFDRSLLVQVALGARLMPDDPVMMIASARNDELLTPVGGFACDTESDWAGFAPLWKYQASS